MGLPCRLGRSPLADGKGFDADRIKARIDQALKPVAAQFRSDRLYAVGGAWRTLAQVQMALKSYPLRVVHQYQMSAEDALETARLVAQQSVASLAKLPGVSKKRAETLPYAGLVLEGLIRHLGLKQIEMSAWGVREGLLFETLDEATRTADPLLAGCTALGGRQGVAPALPGALNGWISEIVAALPEVFGAERDAVLVGAACRLADLGARLHPDHRLELVFDQVLRAPVAGISHVERAFLASAMNARYGGAPATPPARGHRSAAGRRRGQTRPRPGPGHPPGLRPVRPLAATAGQRHGAREGRRPAPDRDGRLCRRPLGRTDEEARQGLGRGYGSGAEDLRPRSPPH